MVQKSPKTSVRNYILNDSLPLYEWYEIDKYTTDSLLELDGSTQSLANEVAGK